MSVVLPCHDVAGFVAAAVRSIHAQTWPEIELVAVDDGSTDGTGAMLDDLSRGWGGPGRSMRVIHRANGGAGAARNTGIAAATGAYVALYDADDLCHPGLVAAQVAALDADPRLDLAAALYRYVDEAGAVQGVQGAPPTLRPGAYELMCDNVVHAPLLRAEAARAAAPLDEALTAHIDLDYFVRVAARRPGNIGIVPEVLSDYRRRAGQITGDWRRMRRNWRRVAEKLEAGGTRFTPAQRRRMRARLSLYWATLAYQGGEYGAARRLAGRALRADPAGILRDAHGRVRLLACGASLLPGPLHGRLRRWFNGRAAQ